MLGTLHKVIIDENGENMQFSQITIADSEWAIPKLEGAGYMTCEFAFANIYMWADLYNTVIADYNGFVIVRNIGRNHHHFLYPVGGTDLKSALQLCLDDASEFGKTPMIYSIPKTEIEKIEELFPDTFSFHTDRKNDDYIYNQSDLAELPGKPYQKKRNHYSRFCREHTDYFFEPLTEENLNEVLTFNELWGKEYAEDNESLQGEHDAIIRVLKDYKALGIQGGIIKEGDKILGFCYASKITDGVLCTHVEKAFHDVNGAYAAINHDFAKYFEGQFELINREDDLGEEGLRKAKLSYRPAMIVPKYYAVLKGEIIQDTDL